MVKTSVKISRRAKSLEKAFSRRIAFSASLASGVGVSFFIFIFIFIFILVLVYYNVFGR
jgi:hypothetical protein